MKSLLAVVCLFLFLPHFTQARSVKKNVAPVPKVFFLSPKDGATVSTKFKVKFGVEGMKIRPAGEALTEKTSGHHHLIVNGTAITENMVVPVDEKHIHYGKGQTEAEVTLLPGEYTLTMQFADGSHISYGERLSSSIKITVK